MATLACVAALLWPAVQARASDDPPTIPSIRIPVEPQIAAKHPISLEDILTLRQVAEPALSPDGSRVAYLVKQSFLSCNCTRTALYVASVSNTRDVRKVDESAQLSSPRWTPDGKRLSFLSDRGASMELWWVEWTGGSPERVFTHRVGGAHHATQSTGIASYEWSPDGQSVAFTTARPDDPAALRDAEANGFRYDEARMTPFDIAARQWRGPQRISQLWTIDLRTRRERLLWEAPAGSATSINTLAWSPDGDELAVSFILDGLNSEGALLEVGTQRLRKIVNVQGVIADMAWAPDGRSLALIYAPPVSDDKTLRILRVDDRVSDELEQRIGDASSGLLWIGDRLYFGARSVGPRRENDGLYEMRRTGGPATRITSVASKVSECRQAVRGRIACVWQSPTDPPRAAVVDFASRSVLRLVGVNPEVQTLELGPVEELHWTNGLGEATNGYLVMPSGARSHVGRLPLVIIGYGFDGDFVAQANSWMTTYPAQAFARDGFAVLLINHPSFQYWPGNDFARGARAFGYSPLSSLRTIIERLRGQGIIDPARVGFMGHSWAGFWAQYAASHSRLLRAIELHNGGTSDEVDSYSATGAAYRAIQDHVMGGGPYPPTLRNYLGFSAPLTTDRVELPVLIECDHAEAPAAFEYYTALLVHHVPVDLIIYPDDGHVFTVPSHRLASMQRDLDWFEFWLQGRKRADPKAAQQYAVWRTLRNELQDLQAKHRP